MIMLSCGKDREKAYSNFAEEVITIDPVKVSAERIKYSTLFDSINYLFIPTDSNFLIGKIDKMLVSDDYIFMMDQKIARAVFGINKKSEKILYINKTGRGPGEYGLMTDIAFSSEEKEILIYCKIKGKILHYNLKGEYLFEENIPFKIRKFYPFNNSYVFYCEYYENKKLINKGVSPNIFLFNSKETKLNDASAYFTPPINQGIVLNSNCQFSFWGDTVSIKPDHCNTVYHVTENGIIPKYFLDFGSYNIDERYWNIVQQRGIKYKEVNDFVTNSGMCENFWFLESSDYLYFTYLQNGKRYDVLYSKKTKNLKQLRFYENDIDQISLFYPKAIYKNKLYCLLKAEEVNKVQKVLPGQLPEKLLEYIDEFGNPIIAEFTLKPF